MRLFVLGGWLVGRLLDDGLRTITGGEFGSKLVSTLLCMQHSHTLTNKYESVSLMLDANDDDDNNFAVVAFACSLLIPDCG